MQKLPSNLEECFEVLKNELQQEDLCAIKFMQQKDICRLHHNLGRWVRNNWKLWESGPLTKFFNELDIHHADDMSGIIIESFWLHLRNEPLELERQIKFYQDFWKKPENQ